MSTDELPDELRRSSAHVLLDDGRGDDLQADLLPLDGDIEHHLVRVLRLSSGESVTATDGAGAWRSYVADIDAGSLRLEPVGAVRRRPRSSSVLTIATAIPKGDRIDWLVQKCTELGADRIVLLHADRSVVRWKRERGVKQVARLQRIADEAVRQSRRVWRVEVDGPINAVDVLADAVIAEPGGRLIAATDRTIAIGPEGGWSPDEVQRAADRVDLGGRVLRTETAAIAATILSH